MNEENRTPEAYERIYLGTPISIKEADVKYFYKNYTHHSLSEMVVDLKTENKRMREALEKIKTKYEPYIAYLQVVEDVTKALNEENEKLKERYKWYDHYKNSALELKQYADNQSDKITALKEKLKVAVDGLKEIKNIPKPCVEHCVNCQMLDNNLSCYHLEILQKVVKFLKQKIKSIDGAVHIATLDEEFIAMQIFRDKLFVATKQNVYFLNKHNKLEPIKFEEIN